MYGKINDDVWLAAMRVLQSMFVRLIGGILKNQSSIENNKLNWKF